MRGDAFKTLIVCRLSYQATEEDLEREFGRIGNIERVRLLFLPLTFALSRLTLSPQIRIVRDTHTDEHPNKKKKPHRGYAFIVFEREKDMRGKQPSIFPPTNTRSRLGKPKIPIPRSWPSSLPVSPLSPSRLHHNKGMQILVRLY